MTHLCVAWLVWSDIFFSSLCHSGRYLFISLQLHSHWLQWQWHISSIPPGKSFIVPQSRCSMWNALTKQSLQVCPWLLVQQKQQHEGQRHSVHVTFTVQVLIWAGNCRLYFLNFLFTYSSSERLHRLFPFFIISPQYFLFMLLVGYSLSVFYWCFSFFVVHFTTFMLLLMLMLMPTCPHCGTNKEISYLILS